MAYSVKFLILAGSLLYTHCVKSVQIRSYFWYVFSCIRIEYGKIRTRNNSVFGQFLRSDCISYFYKPVISATIFRYYFQLTLSHTPISYSHQLFLSGTFISCSYLFYLHTPIRYSYQNSFVTNYYKLLVSYTPIGTLMSLRNGEIIRSVCW